MVRKAVEVDCRLIDDDQPVYIVFEAGQTHQGFEDAKHLIDVAANSGADAIKFQMYDAERLIADDLPDRYSVLTPEGEVEEREELLVKTLKRKEFTKDEWKELKAYADDIGITFFSTFCFEEELDFLVSELRVKLLKICSGDIDHYWLLEKAADTGLPVMIDTGSATLGEVENAVDVLRRRGCCQIVINHCPSGFPADLSCVNLNMITTLRQMFRWPVAFSDHNMGVDMDIAAVALGANMVEKTITTDQFCQEPEHMVSMPVDLCGVFVERIRQVAQAMGRNRVAIASAAELSGREAKRRGIYAKRDITAGETLGRGDIEFRRPVCWVAAKHYRLVIGRKATCDFFEGEGIDLDYLVSEDE